MQVLLLSWALFVALLGTCRGEVGDNDLIDIDGVPAAVAEDIVTGSGDTSTPLEVVTDDEDYTDGSGTTISNMVDSAFSMTTVSAEADIATASNGINENLPNVVVSSTISNEIRPGVNVKYTPDNINNALGQNSGPDKENIWKTIFHNPAILAGLVGGVVLILLTVVLIFLFVVYRIKKKDEGSYSLDEPHKVKDPTAYWKDTKEFYA